MKKPTTGIFKFTSCDGCQLSMLNLEDDILRLTELTEIAYFREGEDNPLVGHLDLAVIEGSISTESQKKKITDIRERSRHLITIGACATAGGVQALRNWADFDAFKKIVYPKPDYIDALPASTPVSEHVHVDYELWGCPIDTLELSEVLTSFLIGKRPGIPAHSLCMECKGKGIACVLVSREEPCLGPVTRSGCGVLCPSLNRACYGCFGPMEGANIETLSGIFERFGYSADECRMMLDKMNTYAFRKERTEKS
ncbi:MAG: hypothetical protein M0Z61_09770 [Nitrospiraceae bacterium]|nr:hypothetical protein [Nitrospiraceae bacterium]